MLLRSGKNYTFTSSISKNNTDISISEPKRQTRSVEYDIYDLPIYLEQVGVSFILMFICFTILDIEKTFLADFNSTYYDTSNS